jgi:polyhydroxybutyrate depolymerase
MHHSSLRTAVGSTCVLLLVSALSVVACGDDPASENPGDPGSEAGAPETGDTTMQPSSEAGSPDPGPTCGPASAKPGFFADQTIMVGTSKRTYQLFVPDTYDHHKSFPVVFVLHGDGGTGTGIRNGFPLEKTAAGGAIFVYPDGENQTWVIDNGAGLLHDVAFIDAVVAQLGKAYCTDAKRIFSVGFSKGAYFTNMLACVSKSNLRAVVAHSGGGPFYLDGIGTKYDNTVNDVVCPSPPPATLQIVGAADSLLDDAKKARDHWERVNTCKATSQPFDVSPCVAYDGCATGRPESYCEIPGMGHQVWSNAPKVIWDFLKTK